MNRKRVFKALLPAGFSRCIVPGALLVFSIGLNAWADDCSEALIAEPCACQSGPVLPQSRQQVIGKRRSATTRANPAAHRSELARSSPRESVQPSKVTELGD
jgi:hypothetical protein